MKYGITLPSRGEMARPENIIPIARKADELGFAVMMFPDHIVMPNDIDSPYPYTQSGIFPADGQQRGHGTADHAGLPGWPDRVHPAGNQRDDRAPPSSGPHRQGAVHHRHPVQRGRLTVGVGVGWLQKEFEALQTPPFEERGAVTDEYIRIFKELWTSESPRFEGKYCSFSDLAFLPKPVQQPHPPIWVGGESRRALRRAAELGDGWQPIGTNSQFPLAAPEQVATAIKRLDRYVEQAGRPRGSVEVVCRMHGYNLEPSGGGPDSPGRPVFTGSAAQIASDIRRYEDMGVSHLIAAFVPVAQLASTQEEMIRDMEMLADQVWPKV